MEPEVLCEGDHDIDICEKKSEKVFHEVFNSLFEYGVLFEGMLLKPNMIIPGLECKNKNKIKPEEIANRTLKTMCKIVLPAVPGICFLSGGQSEYEASVNLNCINLLLKNYRIPWNLSFSYGRALQNSCLKTWGGKSENCKKAQNVLIQMVKNNSEATKGMFKGKGSNGNK